MCPLQSNLGQSMCQKFGAPCDISTAVVISQDGGHSWKAEQDVPGAAPNGGNSLDVIQVGPSTILNSGLQTPAAVTRVGLTAPAMARASGSL